MRTTFGGWTSQQLAVLRPGSLNLNHLEGNDLKSLNDYPERRSQRWPISILNMEEQLSDITQ